MPTLNFLCNRKRSNTFFIEPKPNRTRLNFHLERAWNFWTRMELLSNYFYGSSCLFSSFFLVLFSSFVLLLVSSFAVLALFSWRSCARFAVSASGAWWKGVPIVSSWCRSVQRLSTDQTCLSLCLKARLNTQSTITRSHKLNDHLNSSIILTYLLTHQSFHPSIYPSIHQSILDTSICPSIHTFI